LQLRPYQASLLADIYTSWQTHQNVLAVLPTGGGKTVIFSEAIRLHDGASVAIAHRQELVSQISLALARDEVRHRIIGPQNIVREIVQLQIQEIGRDYYDPSARCAVAGVDTLVRRGDELSRWCQQVTLWVQDEGHHQLTGNKWGTAAAMFPNARGLLVTATPERADGKGLGRHADGLVDVMVEGPGMRQLITDGYLTDYRVFCPPSDLDLSTVATGADGDYIRGQLAMKTRSSTIMGHVVEHYQRIAPGKLGVTFAPDVETATEFAALFNAAGVRAEVVSAKTPARMRSEILRRFRRREILQLVNCDLFGEGFDLPAIEVVTMARATQSYGLYAQQFGRALRIMDGKTHACIAEGELVLTDRGLIPIEQVLTTDKLWDGLEWVTHGGVVYNGEREVITYDGLTATTDHRVKTKEKGWTTFGQCAVEQMALITTGSGRYAVRESDNHFSRNTADCSGGNFKGSRSLQMHHMRSRILDFLYQSQRWSYKWLSKLQPASKCSNVVVSSSTTSRATVHKPQELYVENLRQTGDQVQFPIDFDCSNVGTGALRTTQGIADRSNRQQWSLRGRKFKVVHSAPEHEPYNQVKMVGETTSVQNKIPACKVRRFYFSQIDSYFDREGNIRAVAPVLTQTKRRVWDILNAGPRNCFTVSNRLVHNCIIDHVGNVVRHGLPDRPRVWSLDRRERKSSGNDPSVIPLRSCLNPECMAPYERVHPACPFCGYQPVPAGRTSPELVDGMLFELDPAVLAVMRGEIEKVDRHPDVVRRALERAGQPPMVYNSAAKNQAARQQAQAGLRELAALWMGYQKAYGRGASEAQARWYFRFGTDVLSAQALGRSDAELLMARIGEDIIQGVK
jgi:superfamily II DNA or RNA helicase